MHNYWKIKKYSRTQDLAQLHWGNGIVFNAETRIKVSEHRKWRNNIDIEQ